MGDDASAEFDKDMDAVKEKWTALQNASEDQWDDAKKAFADSVKTAKEKWHDTTGH